MQLQAEFKPHEFQAKRHEVMRDFKEKYQTENASASKKETMALAQKHWMECDLRRQMLSHLSQSELKRRRFL